MTVEHVVIVGAGLGGLRTAEQLRAVGFDGRISLVGSEPHPPYDRPPLSKQVLAGSWPADKAILRDAAGLAEIGVQAHLGLAATGLEPGVVRLADGGALRGDAVVIATGLTARTLPDQPEHAALHTLRTLDDCVALRATLNGAGSLLVVGGGFIGAEVASTAAAEGIAVTVLEALDTPFQRALGTEVGRVCARLIRESGVELRTGAAIARFVEAGDRVAVELADGSRVDADAAVVGVGTRLNVGWLAGSGLDLDGRSGMSRGIGCDAVGRVDGRPGLWAVGDLAAWDDPVHGDRTRTEHWTSAVDQAAAVARDIVGAPQPEHPQVPYFWSDQFGLKIQLIGRPELGVTVESLAGADDPAVKGTAAGYFTSDGRLAAVVAFGAARLIARYRPLVAAAASRAEVLAG